MWQTLPYNNATDNFKVEISAWKNVQNLQYSRKWCAEFASYRVPTLLESPGFFGYNFQVLESPGNLSARSWKVLEFSRL